MACWFIVLQEDVPGLDARVEAEALVGAQFELDEIADEADVHPLMDFYSVNPDYLDFALQEGAPPEALPKENWYPAAAGLESVRALLQGLDEDPDRVDDPEAVVADLRELERILSAAEEAGVDWHLGADY